jgi:hypothetical protein
MKKMFASSPLVLAFLLTDPLGGAQANAQVQVTDAATHVEKKVLQKESWNFDPRRRAPIIISAMRILGVGILGPMGPVAGSR